MAHLDELSSTISKNANVLSQYLASNGLPQPSFRSDGPSTVLPSSSPENIQQARQDLISASLNILHLAIGPSEFLPNLATGVYRKKYHQYPTSSGPILTYPVFSSSMSPVYNGSASTRSSISYLSTTQSAIPALPRQPISPNLVSRPSCVWL